MNPLDLPHEALQSMTGPHMTREQIELLARELEAALNVASVAASAVDREGAFECAICTPAWRHMQYQAARVVEAVYRMSADFHLLPFQQDRERAREIYRSAAAALEGRL